jgi:hypothetical protein
MTSQGVDLAISGLMLFIMLWTIWRGFLCRPRPSKAPLELLCGLGAFLLLMAANSALNFRDRVVFASSARGGPLMPFEWIPAGLMMYFVFFAGGCFGVAASLWFQRRIARQQTTGS